MDCTIGEQEQDLVLVHVHSRLDVLHEFGQQRCEQRGTPETNVRQSLLVSLDNVLDAVDVGVTRVTVNREAVVHRVDAEVTRDSAKAKNGKAAVVIIRFDNHADVQQGTLVLIVVAQVVQRVAVARIAIRCCVVDSCHERDAPA